MDKNLLKIANTLVLNQHNIDKMGLLNGKLGIAIFLFHYGRLVQNNTYTEYAEAILDNVINYIERGYSLSDFEDGICGISWGLDYLVRNAFVGGDISEILEDVDSLLLNSFEAKNCMDFSRDTPLFDIGLYFCLRIKNPQYERNNRIVDEILYSIQNILNMDDPLKASLLNSILYVLNQINCVFSSTVIRIDFIINRIEKKLIESLKSGLYDNTDLMILEKLHPKKGFHITDSKREKENSINVKIDSVWQQLFYGIGKPQYDFNILSFESEIDKMVTSLIPEDMTLKKGVAGLGLGWIFHYRNRKNR